MLLEKKGDDHTQQNVTWPEERKNKSGQWNILFINVLTTWEAIDSRGPSVA